MLLMEFALVFGNDWCVVPLEVESGSICRVRRLLVTDSFGETWQVRPVRELDGDGQWSMFALSDAAGRSVDGLFLPPSLANTFEGPPLEDVSLFRDEAADLGW